MSEAVATAWRRRSAWAGHAGAGRFGGRQGAPGVRFALRDGGGMATIIAADGQEAALGTAVERHLGLALPAPGFAHLDGERGLVWSSNGQWLALLDRPEDVPALVRALQGLAAVTDQGDGRAVVRISGERARDTLQKGVTLDLHPRAFGAGRAAVTSIAHIGAQLWQRDDGPTYDVAVARSFAGSFWSWLSDAAAEHGYEVETAGS